MIERTEPGERPGCVRRLLAASSVLAAIIPGAVWVVMHVPGEDWWGGAALVYAPKLPWLALPVIGILLAIAAWRGRLVAFSLAAGLFTLFAVTGFQLNQPPPLPDDRSAIRVATWNVYGRTTDRDLVQQRIMSWDCDVVCLQEARRALFRDVLPGYESVGVADLRVYVRGEILNSRAAGASPNDPARMLFVEVKTDEGRFEVINIHVPREERAQRTPRRLKPFIEYVRNSVDIREAKFDELLTLLPENQPVILAGDMNTPPASRYHAAIAERLADSFQKVGSGFGHTFVWQQQWPLLRIDYVWSGGGITPLRHQIRPHEPSDHRPVIVDLALAGH